MEGHHADSDETLFIQNLQSMADYVRKAQVHTTCVYECVGVALCVVWAEGGEVKGGTCWSIWYKWYEWTVHVEIKYYMWQIQYRNWILIISLLISSASLSLTHYSTVLPQRINIWFLSRTATRIIVTCITEFPSSTTNSRFTQTCYVNTYINYTSVKQNGSPGEKLRSLITLLLSKCCSTEH